MAPPQAKQALRSFLLGGLLPVLAFTLIEETYGPLWGTVAGMVFGVGEIFWEWRTQGRVSGLTWGGNVLILVLGGVSLVTQEGLWFKLQPALMEGVFALVLWGTCLLGRPLLPVLAEKQGQQLPPRAQVLMGGLTARLGFFFALHAVLATWAALRWSTGAWAALKGAGFTLSMIVYMVAEGAVLRYRLATK